MQFREAKATIRAALRECPDSKLAELLDAARAGQVPYTNPYACLATRIHGEFCPGVEEYDSLEAAYCWLSRGGHPCQLLNATGQRTLTAMILAEIRRRHRVALTAKVAEAVSCG